MFKKEINGMNRLSVALVLCLVLLSGMAVSPAASIAEEQQVISTLERVAQATIKKDIPTLNRLYRDDLTYGHSTGMTQAKPDVLKGVSGAHIVESMRFSDTTVRIYGSVAIAKGITDIRSDSAGKMRDVRLNILWVLVKGSEGWQVAARQPTLVAP